MKLFYVLLFYVASLFIISLVFPSQFELSQNIINVQQTSDMMNITNIVPADAATGWSITGTMTTFVSFFTVGIANPYNFPAWFMIMWQIFNTVIIISIGIIIIYLIRGTGSPDL
jgi:hypothetical protein